MSLLPSLGLERCSAVSGFCVGAGDLKLRSSCSHSKHTLPSESSPILAVSKLASEEEREKEGAAVGEIEVR